MDVLGASDVVLLVILGIAVVLDFLTRKISNRLIFVGLILALTFAIRRDDRIHVVYVLWNIIFPVFCLYLLYLIRALGAGDIKLFSVIGGFVTTEELWNCMLYSFVFAAVLSLGKLFLLGNVKERIYQGLRYLGMLIQGELHAYPREYDNMENVIHFSLAIFLGFITMKFLF